MENTLENIHDVVLNHKINLTENDIMDFLKIKMRWPISYYWNQPSIEIISEFGMNSIGDFFSNDGQFQFYRWKQYYDAGFTTIMSNVLDLNSELRSLSDKLFRYTGSNINGNFYFSKGSSEHRVSFPPHNHEYNVIVKPIYGNCKWLLGNEILENPEQSFIIPTNTSHSVYECLEKKLSLTLNII